MENTTGATAPLLKVNSDRPVHKRRLAVLDRYAAGFYPYEIREWYVNEYNVGEKSFEADVTWVNQELAKQGQYEQQAIIERHSLRYDFIYKQSIEVGDRRSALMALKGLEDLYKLHKDKASVGNVTLSQTNNLNLPAMSVDEIRELLGKEAIIDLNPNPE